MADTHIEVDEGLYHARKLMDPIRELTTQLSRLDDVFASLTQMKDGDGSSAAHFAKVTTLYGTADDATAKALYDEINSAQGNSAALRQLLAKLG